METIRNIKVTATYETETKPSKFDALFAQYRVAKAIADETESTKQPLIDAMGKAKLEVIYKQLDTIVQRFDIISQCTGHQESATVFSFYNNTEYKVTVKRWHKNNKTTIYLDGDESTREWWFNEDGIVTLWNSLGLYEKLEQVCEQQLKYMIESQNKRAQKINNNYNNMIND